MSDKSLTRAVAVADLVAKVGEEPVIRNMGSGIYFTLSWATAIFGGRLYVLGSYPISPHTQGTMDTRIRWDKEKVGVHICFASKEDMQRALSKGNDNTPPHFGASPDDYVPVVSATYAGAPIKGEQDNDWYSPPSNVSL